MIKVIAENALCEVITFAWQACQSKINVSYPLRTTKVALENSLQKSMQNSDDQVLAYYKNGNLIGVIELLVVANEKYLQVRTYIIEDFEEVISELMRYLKQSYPTFKVHFGYPKENIKAIDYFTSNQHTCIESSSDLRLAVEDFVLKANKTFRSKQLTQGQFNRYAHFHDTHGDAHMYWNSTRLSHAFDSWYIYLYEHNSEILGSILISKPVRGEIEIFGLFIEEVTHQYEIIEDLLCNGISRILDKEKAIQQVIFFIEDKDVIQYQVAQQSGFKDNGGYCCYSIDL